MLCLLFADEPLTISLAVINTGSLRISALQLTAPTMVTEGLTCALQSDPSATFTFGPTSQLQPQDGVICASEYAVTTADIEGGPRDVPVSVTGTAAGGQTVNEADSKLLQPVPRYSLDVDLLMDGCNTLMQPGKIGLAEAPIAGGLGQAAAE